LFLIVIDWVMRKTTEGTNTGIPWKNKTLLDDLDFADDLGLLSDDQQKLQDKTNNLVKYAKKVGLHINIKKTETMNTGDLPNTPIFIDGEEIKRTNKFTYLGSVLSVEDGAAADIKYRLAKARNAYSSLNNVWKSRKYSLSLKLKIYNSNVKSILLYGSETWRVVRTDFNKLNTFHTKNMRKLCGIFWPNTISNVDLYARTNSISMEDEIKMKRWRWLGHVIRMNDDKIPKTSLTWRPEQGRRNRGRPRQTWRRTVDKEIAELGTTWREIEERAQDRPEWRRFVKTALCSIRNEEL
jgi:hypothetical protein